MAASANRGRRPKSSLSFAQILQLKMPHHHLHPIPIAQMFCQLLGQIYRAMLSAGAAERHHQALEAATLIIAHAGIDQRHDAGEKLVHALLLIEIIDHWRVFAGESLEALFASGIRDAAAIENESASMSGLVFRQAPVK